MNGKEKLEEIKSDNPVTIQIIREQNRLIPDMEEVVVVWIEDQTVYSIPLNQSLIQSKLSSIICRSKGVRNPQKESLKLASLLHEVQEKKPSP